MTESASIGHGMPEQGAASNGGNSDALAADDRKAVLMRIDDILQNLPASRIHELRARTDVLDAALISALDAAYAIAFRAREQASPLESSDVLAGKPEAPLPLDEARALYAQIGQPRESVGELITTQAFADKALVSSKQTVTNWIEKQRVVAWRSAKNTYRLPAEQLDDAGRLVRGIEQIVPLFNDGYLCWIWLTRPLASLGGRAPLACLKEGNVDRVRAAAVAYSDGSFG